MVESAGYHQHSIRVRYVECDSMGYLHHARYFEFLEEARTEALREQGFRYRDLEADGVMFVVAKLSCRYLRPIRYDDVVEVRTVIERFTRTRIDHSYQMICDVVVAAEASTTLACVGRDGRPIAMPDRIWSIQQACGSRWRDRTDGE